MGHEFTDRTLAVMATVHRSHEAENDLESYERLEFLGDAVLQLAVTHFLFDRYPDLPEGEMAKVRAAVVNESALATIGRKWGVPAALLLGRGEQMTGGRDKSSILSDVVEALLGAVYVDGGYQAAREVVEGHWADLIIERASSPGERDYKTRLQERLAQEGRRPEYVVEERGPEHSKVFSAVVIVEAEVLGEGEGTSKKRAEQAAAASALSGNGSAG
ncbi:MAG: ribonuclease III [Acidimicrobiia bacterium]|nr:ribonuclease III [Acidimicrobiia bacterium]MBT8213649.1 ribonuclease III [Acidimicrobiia bacterium]NNK91735.1 ribonuclease III [Acidimicrobiia bacterium]